MDAAAGGPRRTLRDFITLGLQGISSNIATHTGEVNNYELRSAFVRMVQQMQFRVSPMEYPNLHLLIILEVYTLKLNKVSTDVICLCLFPFLLKDKAHSWLHLLPLDSVTT